ncbi:hypothetical protein D3C73_1419480 [compost metagenome]
MDVKELFICGACKGTALFYIAESKAGVPAKYLSQLPYKGPALWGYYSYFGKYVDFLLGEKQRQECRGWSAVGGFV